jgi:ribosomal protein L20
MKKSQIAINRKMLADLAVRQPEAFAAVVAATKSA